ncbi:MAG: hypothetical protein IKW30_10240 [Lachnospiraceae bacterium]|nr:hypothetical protein [Lachnospiraceae bacterium]
MTKQIIRMKEIANEIKQYYVQNKWLQYVVKACLIIGILMLVVPFVLSEGYTYLCEDDYSFEGGGRDGAEMYGQILGAFHKAHKYYMEAQGTYFANFIWHFVRPYMRYGMPGLHAMMIACMIVFVVSLSLVIRKLCKDETFSLCMIFLTFFAVLGLADSYKLMELLFWYTGTVNFTWVFSFSLLTLWLQLKIRDEKEMQKKWIYAGISAITALIGSGGALMITAVQCSMLLLVLFLDYEEIKENKLIVFPFIMAFAGALWNVVAPGNFVRVDSLEMPYTVGNAIIDTFVHWKNYVVSIFDKPILLLILTIVFIITYMAGVKVISKGVSHLKMIIIVVGVFATQFLTAFPAILGYRGRGLTNLRTSSTYELVAKLTFIFLVICLAQWCRENIEFSRKLVSVIAILIVVFGVYNGKEIKDGVKAGYAYNVAREYSNGAIRENYKIREYILSQIYSKDCSGEDVIIYANKTPNYTTMYGMGLTVDCEAFVNVSAAGLFRVHTVTVIYKEE